MTERFQISDFVPVMNRNPAYAPYEIGDHTYGHPQVVDYGEGVKLRIGKFCSIADAVVFLLGGEHRLDLGTTYPFADFFPFAHQFIPHRKIKGDIIIGNDVWIGHGAFILSGVHVGNGAVIGARAVVTKNVPSYAVAVGSPARIIKYRYDADTILALNMVRWWDWPFEKLETELPLLQSGDMKAFLAKHYD